MGYHIAWNFGDGFTNRKHLFLMAIPLKHRATIYTNSSYGLMVVVQKTGELTKTTYCSVNFMEGGFTNLTVCPFEVVDELLIFVLPSLEKNLYHSCSTAPLKIS